MDHAKDIHVAIVILLLLLVAIVILLFAIVIVVGCYRQLADGKAPKLITILLFCYL